MTFASICLLALGAALPLPAQEAPKPSTRIPELLAAQRERLAKALESATEPALKADLERRHAALERILAAPAEFRVQVSLGEIVGPAEAPQLVRTTWRTGVEYFYPASAIMLCGVAAAFERLNALAATTAPAVTADTPLAFHALKPTQPLEDADASNVDGGQLTLAHLVRRALLVSDDAAYNRLYDFCGQDWLNQRMWRAGLASARLSHRLGPHQPQNARKHTPAIELRLPTGPARVEARWGLESLGLGPAGYRNIYIGKSHIGADGTLVEMGQSFFDSNALQLEELQSCLVRIVRPDLALSGEPFDLTAAQRALALDALSRYPGDSDNPKYDRARYPDAYCKFFLPGIARALPGAKVALYDRVGLAYGFATDNAYVVDTASGRAFFLAATVFTNTDGVMNDNKYDYETLGLPFLECLAEAVVRDLWGPK